MRVQELRKLTRLRLITCGPNDRLRYVAGLLSDEQIGAMPVVEPGGRMVGIISERDICHALADHGERTSSLTVSDVMTCDVAVCELHESVQDVITRMSQRRIRHLPIVDDGKLVGMVSLRDVLEATLREVRLEANVLRDYARALAYS